MLHGPHMGCGDIGAGDGSLEIKNSLNDETLGMIIKLNQFGCFKYWLKICIDR